MKIARFWSKATAEEIDARGHRHEFSCWRGSAESQADAERTAREAAQRNLRRVLSRATLDRYPYATGPLREEIIDELRDGPGGLVGVVTRNAYGCLVLNSARVMFVDHDLPAPPRARALLAWLRRLFGGTPAAEAEDTAEAAGRELWRRFVAQQTGWGMRVYRTAAGLRAIVTHALFDPADPQTTATLEELACDPLYVRLCTVQQSFRARLTPKPWRCRHTANTVSFPFEDDARRQRFEQWQATYLNRQQGFATCRLLEVLGDPTVHEEAVAIIDLHDRLTRCDSALPLA